METNISKENREEFKCLLEKLDALYNKGKFDEEKEILSTDVKNLDVNKKILLALYIFETDFYTEYLLRNAYFDCLAVLFKSKTPLQEKEAILLLEGFTVNMPFCDRIGTKAFLNQIIKQFPKNVSNDFVKAVETFLEKFDGQGLASNQSVQHYLDDLKQKTSEYLNNLKA